MAGVIINLIGFIASLLLAIVLSKGKGAFLLAGYNTMPEKDKAAYDEIALCKFTGKLMYGISFSILLWALSDMFEMPILFIIGLILFVCLIIFGLVYMNTGNRFNKSISE